MQTTQQDFGFVGDAYSPADPYQDRQICVNYYVEVSANKGGTSLTVGSGAPSKTATALLGCPGLIQVASVFSGYFELQGNAGHFLLENLSGSLLLEHM